MIGVTPAPKKAGKMKALSQELPSQNFAGYLMDRDAPDFLKKLARDHWAKYRPKMYSRLQSTGVLEDLLERAVEFTREDMRALEGHLKAHGYSEIEARQAAWEELRAKWILLPQEK
ncbi:MAG: hypothetical protein H6Q55_3464 [Deltaproteobacteria bacterium]|jgi:hypothetical protein|nr:hypothetical protein [Deltaproteobacteria bacterium]